MLSKTLDGNRTNKAASDQFTTGRGVFGGTSRRRGAGRLSGG